MRSHSIVDRDESHEKKGEGQRKSRGENGEGHRRRRYTAEEAMPCQRSHSNRQTKSQVQGHGSRLMNELKMVGIRKDLSHFHTYADNYAIGYFSKHGFTKNLTMSRDRW